MQLKSVNSIEHVLERVIITDECWIWTGRTNGKGYGRSGDRKNEKANLSHRITYEYYIGKIPEGLVIDHLCENKICVNPFHLEPVTHAVNIRRAFDNRNKSDIHCKNGHLWSLNSFNSPRSARNRRCKVCFYSSLKKSKLKKALT